MASKVAQWNKIDDAKLAELFRKPPSRGGVSSSDLSQQHIEQVRSKHWPDRTYKNFSQLFRKKARKWNLNKALQGARKYWFEWNPVSRHLTTLFLISGKPNFDKEDEGEDLADTQAADEEDLKAGEEEEANEIEEIIETVGKMSVSLPATNVPFSLDFQFPYIMYDYKAKERKVVTIDFLILGLNKKCIRPKVSEDGKELHVGIVVPAFFIEDRRLELADTQIRHNTHKMTAFRDVRQALVSKNGDGGDEEPLLGDPQKIQLPFTVEREIRKWEVQTFENDDDEFFVYMQEAQQHFFVLSVTLLSVEKRYKKKEGNFRVFGSPRPRDDMDDDDDGSANEY